MRDEGALTMPIDPMHVLPFFSGQVSWQWSRRVLLRQGKLIEVGEAALLLEVEEEILRKVCRAGGFQWFEHPDDPESLLLFRREVEAFQERRRQKQMVAQEESEEEGKQKVFRPS